MSKRSFLKLGAVAAAAITLPRCTGPDNSWTHYELGMDLYHEGYYQDAVQELSLYSESFLAAQDRGNYFDLVSAEKTQYLIGKIYDAKLSQYQLAAESYEIALTCFPDSTKAENAHFRLGEIYHKELGDFTRAIEQFKLLIKRFPVSAHIPQSYANIAAIYELDLKEYGLAISQYRKMFTLYYNTWRREVAIKCQKKIAELYEKLQNYEQALAEYKYYLEICDWSENAALVQYKIALLYDEKFADIGNAAIEYQKLLDNYYKPPFAKEACLRLIDIYVNIQQDNEKATQAYWYYIENFPEDESCQFFLESLFNRYLHHNDYKNAISTGHFYTEKYQDSFEALYMRDKIARIYRDNLGDYEHAIEEYWGLIENFKKVEICYDAYLNISDIYYSKLKDLSKALQVCSLAICDLPGTGTACKAQYYIGFVHEQEGQFKDAAIAYKKVLDLYGNFDIYPNLNTLLVKAKAFLAWYCSQYDCGFLEGAA